MFLECLVVILLLIALVAVDKESLAAGLPHSLPQISVKQTAIM